MKKQHRAKPQTKFAPQAAPPHAARPQATLPLAPVQAASLERALAEAGFGGQAQRLELAFVHAATLDQKIQIVRGLLQDDPHLVEAFANAGFVAAIGELTALQVLALIENVACSDGSRGNIHIYRAWLMGSAAGRQGPDRSAGNVSAIWFNLAMEYSKLGQQSDKITCLQAALAIKPDCYPAAVNLGLVYEGENKPDQSLAVWRDALQTDEARVNLLNNLGRVLEDSKKYREAQKEYTASLLTNPDQPSVLHHFIGLRARTCDWPTYSTNIPGISRTKMVTATRALTLLAMSDDIEQQLHANATWIEEKMPPVEVPLSGRTRSRDGKIRIGYLSSDFCMHPISYLMAELIETHDRTRYEVVGYCSTKDDGSDVRRRILQAFDSWHDVRNLTDVESAALIRSHDIDVLVDLNGLTLGTRLQVLRSRPAPIQMTYLGYNGPIPLPELDYIIADRYVIPEKDADRYQPKPFYLPRCFQVNDTKLHVETDSTRQQAGLPEDKFVYCCFSNTYKITEDIFSAWMEILARTRDTVLWLFVDNIEAKENLRSFAISRGIEEERLIFADRALPAVYRGRLALADLFLDTFPYNAGTTASDALRVGLPIVTMSGETYISRMAGSLMQAMGATEGIVANIDEYIDFAVRIAGDATASRALRASVTPDLWQRTLGDTVGFCRDFEMAIYELVGSLSSHQ